MSTVSGYRFSNDEVQIHVQCSLDLEWTPQLTATCEGASSDNIVGKTLRAWSTVHLYLQQKIEKNVPTKLKDRLILS